MIKLSIIGLGRISQKHIDSIKKIKDIDITCVSDVSDETLSNCDLEVPKYKNYLDMLKEQDHDTVLITTPSGLHKEIILACLKHGKSVIVEKPLALTVKDCNEIISIKNKLNLDVIVVKQLRTYLPFRLIYKLINEGAFGDLKYFSSTLFCCRPESYFKEAPWRGTKALDGGTIFNQLSHQIDLCFHFFGPVSKIFAFSETLLREIETEDSSSICIKFKSGALGSISFSVIAPNGNVENSITILGTKGSVKIGGSSLNLIENWSFQDEENNIFKEGSVIEDKVNYDNFYNNLINDKDSPEVVRAEDGLESVKIIESIYNSSHLNKEIIL